MKQLNAVVTYNEKLNDEYHVMRIKPIEGEISDFTPGQYAELGIPDPRLDPAVADQKMVRRLYSIASPNTIKDYLEFYIVSVKGAKTKYEIKQIRKAKKAKNTEKA